MADSYLYAIVLIALLALNLGQFILFARELQKLVDKVMSRDFAEYQRVSVPKKNTSPRIEQDLYEERPPEGFVF